MTKKKVTTLLLFLLCVTIPTLILSLFPSPCGYGLCLLIYYPIIFLAGGLSAWTYYTFGDRVKLKKSVSLLIILLLDFAFLSYLYPKGEYSPTNQLREAIQVAKSYENLKPIDIFKATEDKNFLLITALYHKYNLPTETYLVKYCSIDEIGSYDTIFKEFKYFISDNKVVTNNLDFDYNLDLKEGLFTFNDSIEQIQFSFKVGYPDFGKYRETFTNTSSEISDSGERVTALTKDTMNFRVIVEETKPKFEYRFTRLFEKYLSLKKQRTTT